MINERVERSAGWSGLAFAAITLVAAFLPGVPPASTVDAAGVAAYVDAHRFAWVLAAWLSIPGVAFYLWWLVQLRAFLRLASKIDDGLPAYLFAGGVSAAVLVLLTAGIQALLGFRTIADFGPGVVRVLFDAFNVIGAMTFLPLAVVVLAASHSGRRHGSLPRGLVVLGYLTAAGCSLSTLSLFFKEGALALGGVGTAAIGLLPLAVWIVWASIVLVRVPASLTSPR